MTQEVEKRPGRSRPDAALARPRLLAALALAAAPGAIWPGRGSKQHVSSIDRRRPAPQPETHEPLNLLVAETKQRWRAGVVICLKRGADLHTAQLMTLPLTASCFSKIQIGFTFLVSAYPGSPV